MPLAVPAEAAHFSDPVDRIESVLKLLSVHLAIFVQDMCIYLRNHINLCMACIALCGLQVPVVELQLVSSAGMSERVKYHVRAAQPSLSGLKTLSR